MDPSFLTSEYLQTEAWKWLTLLAAVAGSFVVGVIVAKILRRSILRVAVHTETTWDNHFAKALDGPLRLLLTVLGFSIAVNRLQLTGEVAVVATRGAEILLILGLAWLARKTLAAWTDVLHDRLAQAGSNDLEQRAALTQGVILRRIGSVVILILTGALILLQFESVREIGVSLLASAGIASVVIGLAAQRSIGALLAGIQLSFAQPIRVGDIVIVEGAWGRIEEITLTYVVVKIWDERRLVVPTTYFLEKPFENWTKTNSELLGTVELPADYAVPIDEARAELKRYVESHAKWDQRVCLLHVTEANQRTITLRMLVSAESASNLWDLRCDLREHMVSYLQNLQGGSFLPKLRLAPLPTAAGESS